jgi:glycosyltransferase involved in cell wall biosynthesis
VLPLVSVVIPTFNSKELLLRALRSVSQQTYRPLEVIVVDDCSTDGTAEALAEQDLGVRVRVLRSSVNLGPAGARNKGIAAATGKYIAFLDNNNHWLPLKLARQMEAAESHAGRDALVVYTQAEIRRRSETRTRPLRPIGESEQVADYLFADGGYMAQPTVLVSTSVAREVMFRPELRRHEDWDWYIRLQQQGVKFVMVPACLCIVDDVTAVQRANEVRPERSLSTLETWKPLISRRAYLAFRARIAPQICHTAPVRAVAMILQAYLHGAISAGFLVVLIGRFVHPTLRQLARKLAGSLLDRGRSRAVPHGTAE